ALLRAHPAEARIDPAFTVLEEIEADMLLEQAIDATLAAAAREGRPSAPLIEIFSYLSAHEVKAALTSLVRQGASAAVAMAHLEGKAPADIFAAWQQSLCEAREAAARAIVESDEWRESARVVARLAAL